MINEEEMLTVEEIRKLFFLLEEIEDFKTYQIIYSKDVRKDYGNFTDWEKEDFIYLDKYPHFLTRVIEALNKSKMWQISIDAWAISGMKAIEEKQQSDFFEYNIGGCDTKLSPDQVKEKAIKYILKNTYEKDWKENEWK
jgi:hypothetical protein